ncbi:hypothetical protein GCM10023178_74860 [Actinomadura luteofluorescens]
MRRARGLIRDQLARWGLEDMSYTTTLLASELVTNAIRHAGGRIGLRLVREGGLVCEVFDSSDGRPRIRHHDEDDEASESGPGPARRGPAGAALGRAPHQGRQSGVVRAVASVKGG